MKNFSGKYSADGGAIRIDTPDAYFHYLNGVGDGRFRVRVIGKASFDSDPKEEFIGSFGVKTNATISGYDGEDDPICILGQGRYGIHRDDHGNITIQLWVGCGV